jgi:hypothetical protein
VTLALLLVIALAGFAQPASAKVIESYSLKLDRRCQVAVIKAVLTRPAPVGIQIQGEMLRLVGRVPLVRRGRAPLVHRGRGRASAVVHETFVWDLSLPSGRYLKPGRYTTVLRAFDAKRKRVIDRSKPVDLVIPDSFRSPPRDCGS